MINLKKAILLLYFISLLSFTFSEEVDNYIEENEQFFSYDEVFEKYLESNLNIQELLIKKNQAALDLALTKINNGFSFSISSGNSMLFSETGTEFSFSPVAELNFPQLNNTSISTTFPATLSSEQSGISEIDGAGISFSTDVFSNSGLLRQINLQKANRAFANAQLNYENGVKEVEKLFLTDLQELVNARLSLISLEDDLITEQTDFEKIKASGYDTHSVTYKKAEIALRTSELDYEDKSRAYKRLVAVFSSSCGIEFTDINIEIPDVDLISITTYVKENFSELESANYTHTINSLSRKANEQTTTVSVNGGYKYTDTATKDDTHSINGGVSYSNNGVTIGAGIDVPVNNDKKPSVTLSLGWVPQKAKTAQISKEQNKLEAELELLDIQKAEETYESTVIDKEAKLVDLDWQLEKNLQEESLYKDLLTDTEKWYSQGIISSTEYRETLMNYKKSITQLLLTRIDRLLYNLELQSLFRVEANNENKENN